MSDSLQPHEPQHARPPCPSPTPGVYPNWCPLSRWCHPIISSSVVPFSSCPQSFPASGSFQMSQPFASGGQSIGVSAPTSVLPIPQQEKNDVLIHATTWMTLKNTIMMKETNNKRLYWMIINWMNIKFINEYNIYYIYYKLYNINEWI